MSFELTDNSRNNMHVNFLHIIFGCFGNIKNSRFNISISISFYDSPSETEMILCFGNVG